MLASTTNQIRKTTVTRFVHILAAVERSHWEPNRFDQLTTTDPTSAVPGSRFLPPTSAQRASYHTTLTGDSALEFAWVPDLGSLHHLAPIELTADRSSAASNLVFPSVHPLDMSVWNEEREVKVPQPEATYS